MRRESGDQHDPPPASWCEQQRGEENCVGRPQRGDRDWPQGQRKTKLGAEVIGYRHEDCSRAVASFASTLTEEEWQTEVPHDGRKVGVTVHHVASMYPLEMQLAQGILKGDAQVGVTWDAVAGINAKHAGEFDGVTKE